LFIIGLSPDGSAQDKAKKSVKERDAQLKAAKQKGKKNAKKPMTAEEWEAYNARLKGKYKYYVKFLNRSVAQIENRREGLEALIEQEETSVSPPAPGMFSNALQPSSVKNASSAKKRNIQAKTFGNIELRQVSVTKAIKDAARSVIEAMEAHLPLIHDQADEIQARIAAIDNPPAPAEKKPSKPSTSADVVKAKAAVDKAEANLSIVLASAWFQSVSKSQNASAKDTAMEATRSIAKYLELKRQYEELGAQLGVVSEKLDAGVKNIFDTLYPRPVKSKKTKIAPEKKQK
jgi:hypothetical protein